MQLRLWSPKENAVFYSTFARNIILNSGAGLRLNRGILDMSALQLILRELESGNSDWMTMEDLEENYPGGIWWEMMLYLAEMHGQMNSHTIYEVNYKILKAVETIIVPLNNIFYRQVPPQYLIHYKRCMHPLTDAILKYCSHPTTPPADISPNLSAGKNPVAAPGNFIDCFMLGMIEVHGSRMIEFLRVCRESIYAFSGSPPQSEDLVKAMERLSIAS
ncbi:hypothetical protein LPJ53_004602 [Coemansia erecta]|uniref:Uncharacterized protein n=1 Tax=Coemansia erecta TaxID=147472 RepID=A0A9W7XYK6_9FUNG|nr:hypothetical protein LPJ53_004602 [Coemansia erecta]